MYFKINSWSFKKLKDSPPSHHKLIKQGHTWISLSTDSVIMIPSHPTPLPMVQSHCIFNYYLWFAIQTEKNDGNIVCNYTTICCLPVQVFPVWLTPGVRGCGEFTKIWFTPRITKSSQTVWRHHSILQ